MSTVPTAKSFIFEKIQELRRTPNAEDTEKWLIEFAKLHVEAADKNFRANVSLKETTSEELNSEEYKPFVTAEDGTIWTLNFNDDYYPLTNIK